MRDLVNELTQQLAEARRMTANTAAKLARNSRSLTARTQELAEARAALSLLLATLDATADGVLALGHFGRAVHYNARFIEMWDIAEDRLATLNGASLLALQLAQVKDPEAFLRAVEAQKQRPDEEHRSTVELTDGRVFECRVVPQRVRGRRVGMVTCYREMNPSQASFSPVRNMPA